MMKNILSIIFLLISYNVIAQRLPSGTPTQFSTGWFKQGYQQSDSGTIVANRDTTWKAKYSGTIVFRPADKKFYYFDSTTLFWYPLVTAAIDTTPLHNQIVLKLNITDTTSKWWGIGKRWADTLYRVNDSTVGYTINGTPYTFQILGRLPPAGSGLTSVGLSMPSAFTVTNSPLTSNGTISISGAGTTAQYIRGNGTLATTDTSMIPNYYLKVRGLLSGSSPITFNQTTGIIGALRANTTGQLGVATFNNSEFTDNGAGLISLRTPTGSGVDTFGLTDTIGVRDRYMNMQNNGLTIDSASFIDIAAYGSGSMGRMVLSNAVTLQAIDGTNANYINVYNDNISFNTNLSNKAPKIVIQSSDSLYTSSPNAVWVTKNDTMKIVPIDSFSNIIVSASNGLTKTANDIQLGGTLIKSTTISSSVGANRIAYTGVSAFGDGAQLDVSTTGSIGIAVRGGTTDGRGVFGIASGSGVGVYGSGVGSGGIGVFSITTDGSSIYSQSTTGKVFEGLMQPATTNTVESVGSYSRSSSVTGANGIGGSLDFNLRTSTADQLTNQIIWKLTDATNATRTSALEFWNINSATLGRKANLAGSGQWTWDGYPALTAQTDTTTYKPVAIDGSGNVVKMAGWTGGGSIIPGAPTNSIQFNNASSFAGDSLQYYPASKYIFTSRDYMRMGRYSIGYWQDTTSTTSSGYTWMLFPKHSYGEPGSSVVNSDSLQPFFSEINSVTYDVAQPQNPVYTLLQFGRPGNRRPMASIRLEQGYYGSTEYHVLSTIPRAMVNPNEEIRHLSFYISQIDGFGQQQNQISNVTWAESQVGTNYNKLYATLNPTGFNVNSFNTTQGSLSIVHGTGVSTQIGGGILADSLNHTVSFYASSNAAAMYMGSSSGGTAIDIGNPATSGGTIQIYKQTLINNKELRVANMSNNALGLSATSTAFGYIFSVSTDGSGLGDTRTTGTFLVNKEPAQAASTRMLGIYNNYNANDSIFHVRGTGDLYAKGIITARADSTTSATGGFVYRDAITGNFRITAGGGSATTIYNGDGTVSGNRIVTGSSNSLTFSGFNLFRVYSNYFYQAKSDGTRAYASAIDPSSTGRQSWQFGYSPFTRGVGLYVDTLNNVGLGDNTITTMPLYTTGNSAYVRNGFQSQQGNFYGITNVSSTSTLGLTDNFCVIDATSGNITITLPSASAAFAGGMGLDLVFKRIDNSVNTITVQRSGSDQIDGANSFTLPLQYDSKKIRAISTSAWAIYQ
jgi:hypothetical protein